MIKHSQACPSYTFFWQAIRDWYSTSMMRAHIRVVISDKPVIQFIRWSN